MQLFAVNFSVDPQNMATDTPGRHEVELYVTSKTSCTVHHCVWFLKKQNVWACITPAFVSYGVFFLASLSLVEFVRWYLIFFSWDKALFAPLLDRRGARMHFELYLWRILAKHIEIRRCGILPMGQYLRFECCLYSFYLCLLTDRRSFDDAQSRLKCRKLLGIGGKEPSKVSHYSKLNNPLMKPTWRAFKTACNWAENDCTRFFFSH